jgi:hypothetical protein
LSFGKDERLGVGPNSQAWLERILPGNGRKRKGCKENGRIY